MSELTIRAFLNDGGKLKKVKADKKIMDKANELVGSLRSTPEGSNEDNNLLNLIRKRDLVKNIKKLETPKEKK
jgi:hypothetical protein|tara:strand:- start:122 stop:340 length:219 start_codon:yes stop_codon:yes gene_type:complete